MRWAYWFSGRRSFKGAPTRPWRHPTARLATTRRWPPTARPAWRVAVRPTRTSYANI